MENSLDLFIKEYCIIGDGDFIKVSRFNDCYKGFCYDNNMVVEELSRENLNKYDVDIIIMNNDKWLRNIKIK